MSVTLTINPPWPGLPFNISCPDTLKKCKNMQTPNCWEPEIDTFEVITSLLMHCNRDCHYVDIGCNMGIFARHAHELGASVTCYEPQSVYKSILEEYSKKKYFDFEFAAISMKPNSDSRVFTGYRPCGIGVGPKIPSPFVHLEKILVGNIKLLKIDIDSFEGAILSACLNAIRNKRVYIESILVELGDGNYFKRGTSVPNPRGGNISDIWEFQKMSYDVYRLNLASNGEIYDRWGNNIDQRMTKPDNRYKQVRFLRNIRRAELLKEHSGPEGYDTIIDWGQSFLITKQVMIRPLYHHPHDLRIAHKTSYDI